MLASLLTLAVLAAPGRALPVRTPQLAAPVRVADLDAPQSLKLGLVMRDRAGLDALIAAQHDPASQLFRQWLTPAQLGERFGVSAAQYEALARQLEKAGLHVTRFPNRLYLDAQGTVGQVQQLLGVKLVDVGPAGSRYRSFQGTPRLPGELAKLVQSVGGLDGRPRFHHRLQVGNQQTFGPQDLRRFYDIDALHQQGFGGQLSKVAVIGTIPDTSNTPVPAEVEWFYRNVSDSTAQYIVDTLPLGSASPDSQQGLKVELEMDSELPTVAAPLLQSVTIVLAPNASLFPDAMNHIVNNLSDLTAVSISFGACELDEQQFAPGEIGTVSNLLAEGVAEGIAWFSASGDYGNLTCSPDTQSPNANTPSVDFPSGEPYMTAVGGTMYLGSFDSNGAIPGYDPGAEVTWHEGSPSSGFEVAGGGGVSTLFPRPVWQTGPGTSSSTFREVPDVSLVASSRPGVAIVSTRPGVIDPIGNGTSDAAPLAAGMFALVNDVSGGCRLGTPNPELYALGRAQYGASGTAVFHDIVSGTIGINGVAGPDAGPGYDEATGLGSLDVTALATAWPACPPPPAVVDGGDVDAGPVDDGGSALDAGPADDGGSALDAGPAFDAGYIVWDGGPALDAGPRSPYVPCDVLACDGGALCTTQVEGPSQCLLPCDPSATNTCGAGNFCSAAADAGGFCVPGCGSDSDCTGGQVCQVCSSTCMAQGNVDAGIGVPCTTDADCNTGGFCLPDQWGLPGGYCTQDCTAGCGCPTDTSQCAMGFCMADCDLATQTGCRAQYACDPLTTRDGGFRDVGACLPDCRTSGCFRQSDVCDQNTGVCAPPGWVQPTPDAGSSSSSSSGSTSGSTTGTTGTTTGGTTGSGTTTGGTTSSGTSTGGTTGGNKAKGGGCGCGAGSEGSGELGFALLFAAAGWLSRRRSHAE